jgi:acyl carrier protein
MNVENEVRAFLGENFPLAADMSLLPSDASLIDGGIVDSLGILELVGFLTDRFGVVISDEDLVPENLGTIEAIARYVDARAGAGAGAVAAAADAA